jgi:hypothetical protein
VRWLAMPLAMSSSSSTIKTFAIAYRSFTSGAAAGVEAW